MQIEVTDTQLITTYEYGEQMADGTFNYVREGFRVRRDLTEAERAAKQVAVAAIPGVTITGTKASGDVRLVIGGAHISVALAQE